MRGTKRLNQSDSNPDMNDSAFGSKRVMAASPFGIHREELSQQPLMAQPPLDVLQAQSARQHLMEAPPLDAHRAQLARQHVRALNTQFASWVQLQLQDHPDELWEDGAQDYLAHAKQIMEKFRDVVDWLKENAPRTDNAYAVGSLTTGKKLVPEAKKNEIKLFQEKRGFTPSSSTASFSTSWNSSLTSNSKIPVGFSPSSSIPSSTPSFATSWNSNLPSSHNTPGGFAPSGSTASFATSWNSSLMSKSQTPFLFGSQSTVPSNCEASDDLEENELEQPSSPSVKKTEEKGIILVHEVKCKLYVKSSDPADKETWKDKGTGQLSIKCKEGVSKATRESKPTIVVRNDVGKLLLNALLYPGIKTNLQKNSIVAIFHTSGDGGNDDGKSDNIMTRTYLIRTKTEEERNKLATAIQEYAPGA